MSAAFQGDAFQNNAFESGIAAAVSVGAAYAPSVSIVSYAGVASGTGTGYDAAPVQGATASAEVATGSGVVSDAARTLAFGAGVAAGSGAAQDAIAGTNIIREADDTTSLTDDFREELYANRALAETIVTTEGQEQTIVRPRAASDQLYIVSDTLRPPVEISPVDTFTTLTDYIDWTLQEIRDDIADVMTVTDPPMGVTVFGADFRWFSTAWASPWIDQPYSGWLKIVLTQQMTLSFDTFGSEADDTVMKLFSDAGVTLLHENDDVQIYPYWDAPELWRKSHIPGGQYEIEIFNGYLYRGEPYDRFTYPAGDYWITVYPYSQYEPGDIQIRVTRYPLDVQIRNPAWDGLPPDIPSSGIEGGDFAFTAYGFDEYGDPYNVIDEWGYAWLDYTTDSLVRAPYNLTRAIADTFVTPTDEVQAGPPVVRSASDTIPALTESTSHLFPIHRIASETLVTTESLDKIRRLRKTTTDSITAISANNLPKRELRYFEETLVLTDTSPHVPEGFSQSIEDTLAELSDGFINWNLDTLDPLTDAADRITTIARSAADGYPIFDTISAGDTATTEDTIDALTDSVFAATPAIRTCDDTISISESVEAPNLGYTYIREAADAATGDTLDIATFAAMSDSLSYPIRPAITGEYVLVDDPANAQAIIDPPTGELGITGDFDSFSPTDSPDPVDPPALRSNYTWQISTTNRHFAFYAPTGTQIGDQLYAFVSYDALNRFDMIITPDTLSTASRPRQEWQHVHQVQNELDNGLDVWTRVADVYDTAAMAYPAYNTFRKTYTCQSVLAVIAIDGAGEAVTDWRRSSVSTVSHTPGTLVSPSTGKFILVAAGAVNNSWTSPTGMTEFIDKATSTLASVGVFYLDSLIGQSYTPIATSSVATTTTLFWLFIPNLVPTPVVYSGWAKIVLTSQAAFKFDTHGSAMADTTIAIFDDLASPPIFSNDDTSVIEGSTWSSIPSSGSISLAPGTYYIRVSPNASSGWVPGSGDATLRITRTLAGQVGTIYDNYQDAPWVSDLPIGETYFTADFSTFSPVLEDGIPPWILGPTGFSNDILDVIPNPGYIGHVLLEFSEPGYYNINTLDSGITDLRFFLGYETKNYTYQWMPGPAGTSITGTFGPSSSATGRYWVFVIPKDGAAWEPDYLTETGHGVLRITRMELVPSDQTQPPYDSSTRGAPPSFGPPPRNIRSTVTIKVDDVDITDDVLIETAEFTGQVNGVPGEARFQVKDVEHLYEFITGGELTLDIETDGVTTRHWGGYIRRVTKTYPFPVLDTTDAETVARYWTVEGVDYNILFTKRFVFKPSDPTGKIEFSYPIGTYDKTIIDDIFDNYLDLTGDGITRTGVNQVSIVTLDIPGVTSGKGSLLKGRGAIASASYSWKQVMDVITKATGAIYYINPDKEFCYADVDVASAKKALTDTPTLHTHVGYREFELLYDGMGLINDMLLWGAGLGSALMVTSRKTNSASQTTHGVWQEGLFTPGIIRQATADAVAQSYLTGTPQSKRGHKDDQITLRLKVFNPYFRVGDKVTTKIGIYGYQDVIPIRRSTITFANPWQPIFELSLGHLLDDPMQFLEIYPISLDESRRGVTEEGEPEHPTDECRNGLINGTMLDSFSRSLEESYSPSNAFPASTPGWGQGEFIDWSVEGQNVHYNVRDGHGRIEAINARYVQVLEYGWKNAYGTIDVGIPKRVRKTKFRLGRMDRLGGSRLTDAHVVGWTYGYYYDPCECQCQEECPPQNWVNPEFIATGERGEGWGDVATRPAQATWDGYNDAYISAVPIVDEPVTGTLIHGDTSGAVGPWYPSNGGGFVPWYMRYADGSSWCDAGARTDFYFPDGPGGTPLGLHYIPAHSLEVGYITSDSRTGDAWTTDARFTIDGVGFSRGGVEGPWGTTNPTHVGGDFTVSVTYGPYPYSSNSLTMKIDPEVHYWVMVDRSNWYGPRVKIWRDGEAEPADWMLGNLTNEPYYANTGEGVNNSLRSFTSSALVICWQQYAVEIDEIWGGDGLCDDDGGSAFGPHEETPIGDGCEYQLDNAFIGGSPQVFVNGERKVRGLHYTERAAAGIITFIPPCPTEEDTVLIYYDANGKPMDDTPTDPDP